MSKTVAVLALVALSIVAMYLTMTQGWGLQVQSWGWLVGGILGQVAITTTLNAVKAEK